MTGHETAPNMDDRQKRNIRTGERKNKFARKDKETAKVKKKRPTKQKRHA